MLKKINIHDLHPGMVIVRVTSQNGPVKIKKSGLVTSQDMVQGLIEMGIQQVEVDTDQTVELEVAAPKIKKSATRRMLDSNTVFQTQNDEGVSDQFHRSLYLPSVQDIPSAWQFYTKRYLLAVLIVLGGLGFGWTLANYQAVFNLFSSAPEKQLVLAPAPVQAPIQQETTQLNNESESATAVDKPQITDAGETLNEEVKQVAALEETTLTDDSNVVEQIIDAPPEPEPQISADLLERFKEAINEVEDSATTSAPVKIESSNEDVPRVDQLPAWAMTRLPSMAFSAHMYASVDSERWVRVNGTRMVEGDKIDGVVEIVRIEPQHVILNFSGQSFSMAALTDW
jgi:general secretion pathway protein B